MRRNVVLGVVAALLLAAGGYFLFFRDRGDDKKPDGEQAEAGEVKDDSTTSSRLAPPPLTQRPQYDAEPEGPLRLEGQVLGPDGDPVGGARVTLQSYPPRTAETEDDGSFYFDKLIGRTYALSARADDLAGGPIAHELTESSPPAIIRMRQGGRVEVTVIAAASDRPISGATVQLRAADLQTATSDGDGKARFRGVVSGWLVVAASAPGYGTGKLALMMPGSAGAELKAEIKLEAGFSIAGTVVDPDGKPVAKARVMAQSGELIATADPRYDGVVTGADGTFELRNVAAGRVHLVAHHDEYVAGSAEIDNLGNDVKGVTIELKPGGVIAGKVVSESGAPVPWASIVARPKGGLNNRQLAGQTRGGRSDKDGAFELKGLPRSQLNLVASTDEASSELVAVDLSGRERAEVEVVLSITGSIAGKVVDGEGEPVAEVQVVLMPDWTSGLDQERFALRNVQTRTTGGGGDFRFGGLEKGKFILRPGRDTSNPAFWQSGGTPARTGDTDVELKLLADGGVKGKVISARGEPITSFSVVVGYPPGHPVVDPDGAFELDGLAAGEFDLKITGADFAEKTVADVVIEPGEVRDVGTIKVALGRTLSGRVVDASGSPVAGATVAVGKQLLGSSSSITMARQGISDEMMGLRRATSASDGSYRVRGLGQDELVAAAEHPESGRSRPFTLPAEQAAITHEFRLVPTGAVFGTVKKGDAPLSGVNVLATPEGAHRQVAVTQADDKGAYRFDRLSAGRYQISAMVGGGLSAKKVTASTEVKSGAEVEVPLVAEVGDVTLEARAIPASGARVDNVQMFLFAGEVSPSTGTEVNQVFLGQEGTGGDMQLTTANTTVSFKEQTPGQKTLCAIPITGDMQDPQFLQRLQAHADKIKVYCEGVVIKASPATQSSSITVPEMEPLPPPQ